MSKLPSAIKELRFFLSQSGEASQPLKSFLSSHYPLLKKSNPSTLFLIRESSGIPPSVTVRYEFGKEQKTELEGLNVKGIEEAIGSLAK